MGLAVGGKLTEGRDPAFRLGIAGMLGLGLIGMATFALGLVPGGFQWGLWVVGLLGVSGLFLLGQRKEVLAFTKPNGLSLAAIGGLGALLLIAFLAACGPSDSMDWDSLAYHLAVPKLWIEARQMIDIRFIHQSNFPFLADNLFVWGLQWGGEAGAKAFMAVFLGLGMLCAFGWARPNWGEKGGFAAAFAFATMPVVLWESGTAYIDVPHGIFAGVGMLLLGEWTFKREDRASLILGALMVGGAAATKYTGLQVIAAAAFVVGLAAVLQKDVKRAVVGAGAIAVLGMLCCAPWLARNAANYGNPVYPFFYERFGGENWDQFAADIYRNEQQTFGVGRTESGRDPSQVGHAMFGLAYQPGRYVNPGQTQGMGFPTGALGFVVIAAGALWWMGRRWRPADAATLGMVLTLLAMWFFLSQQSRYLVIVGFPLAVFAGACVAKLKAGHIVAGALVLQALYSVWLVATTSLAPKLPVVLGSQTLEEFRAQRLGGSAAGAAAINALPEGSKVALYDEVFGFLLDRPYFWANPGHSTIIPYPELNDGAAFAAKMRELGFTHAFLNARFWNPEQLQRFAATAGLGGDNPYSQEELAGMMSNREIKWQALIMDALRTGKVRVAQPVGGRALLLEFAP